MKRKSRPNTHVEITAAQLNKLKTNVLNLPELQRKRVLKSLLEFMFDNAVDKSLSPKDLVAGFFKNRAMSETRPRLEVARLRNLLADYFAEGIYPEPIRIVITHHRYQLKFELNDPAAKDDLERFWLPFTVRKIPVRIVVGQRSDYWDTTPKRDPKGPPAGPREVLPNIFLPTGLLRALFQFSEFFQKNERRLILDTSPKPNAPTNSVIIVGETPLPRLKPREVTIGSYRHERAGEVDFGVHADNFREEFGIPVYCCYARIFRIPISREDGVVALRILANHSIAIEAAAIFLLSPTHMKHLHSRMKPLEERTNRRYLFGDEVSPELASTVEELAVVLRVMCSFTSPEAQTLRPGVPHGHLKILAIEPFEISQPITAESETWDTNTEPEPDPEENAKTARPALRRLPKK
jgi:hypothetical protein